MVFEDSMFFFFLQEMVISLKTLSEKVWAQGHFTLTGEHIHFTIWSQTCVD